jgi:hypothetical protein
MPSLIEADAKARHEQADIVLRLKRLLGDHTMVGDDANHKQVALERRHWMDATIDIYNSSVTHGAQTWTNVEIRPRRSTNDPIARFTPRTARAHSWINDIAMIKAFLQTRKSKPELSVRVFVLEHEREIKGSSPEAKIRRIQRKLKKQE